MVTLAAAFAVLIFSVVFLAALLLLAIFVRKAAEALLTLGELRERTDETDERRATVASARHAVEEIHNTYGGSGDPDEELLRAVQTEAALRNGKPYRVADNENLHAEQDEGPSIEGDSFYVPTTEQ